ncbi:MAG: hypothetical protein GX957_00925 [Clostridiaceae bacterium]|nr:hypothetical protein [Clostridiaceae bacterium]
MVLFLSNGHGEDLISAMIGQKVSEMCKSCDRDIFGFPLVGLGKAYANANIEILGTQKVMPSGGFLRHGMSYMIKDIKEGLIKLTLQQIKDLKSINEKVKLIISVGDIYPLILGGRYVNAPMLFLSTAKSEYIQGHFSIESKLMKKYADLVLARDEKTSKALIKKGVNAKYAGNVMMDGFSITGENFGFDLNKKVVGILPGSREEAYRNIKTLLDVVLNLKKLSNDSLDFIIGFAPNLDKNRLKYIVNESGWIYESGDVDEEGRQGITAYIYQGTKSVSPCIIVSQGRFGDVLNISSIVIGLSGTGNEQAAGLGKPVVTFITDGPQFNLKFALAQKKLLGEAVEFIESRDTKRIAKEVMGILKDSTRISKMRNAGYKRMGKQGAAKRIGKIIVDYIATESWG